MNHHQPNCSFLISGLHIPLYLGWPHEERSTQQVVVLDIQLAFPQTPMACTTDSLEDTICYAKLAQSIVEKFSLQSFHLIEYLGKHIYDFIASNMSVGTHISLDITKHPTIRGLHGFVRFRYQGMVA